VAKTTKRSPLISEEDEPALLALLRYLVINDPGTIADMEDFEPDTFRSTFNPSAIMRYRGHPLFQPVKHLVFEDKRNARAMVKLVRNAEEFQEARPTLLRHAVSLWHGQVKGRQANQRELRKAAITAVALRAIHEDTDNVLMSWDSMSKLIQGCTGVTPGRQPLARLFEWLGSDQSPFEVVRKGEQGKFRKSTMIKVKLPWLDWTEVVNEIEHKRTADWLAQYDRAFSDLLDDEILRRRTLPERKARYAKAADIRAQLDQFGSLDSCLLAGSTTGNVEATSLSRLTVIDEKKTQPTTVLTTVVPEPTTTRTAVVVVETTTTAPVELSWVDRAREIRAGRMDLSQLVADLDFGMPIPASTVQASAEKASEPIPV
jgi:hypothetical protein